MGDLLGEERAVRLVLLAHRGHQAVAEDEGELLLVVRPLHEGAGVRERLAGGLFN